MTCINRCKKDQDLLSTSLFNLHKEWADSYFDQYRKSVSVPQYLLVNMLENRYPKWWGTILDNYMTLSRTKVEMTQESSFGLIMETFVTEQNIILRQHEADKHSVIEKLLEEAKNTSHNLKVYLSAFTTFRPKESPSKQFDPKCIICDDPSTHIFVPCGHYITCSPCCDSIIKGTNSCPVCRQSIKRAIKVYL